MECANVLPMTYLLFGLLALNMLGSSVGGLIERYVRAKHQRKLQRRVRKLLRLARTHHMCPSCSCESNSQQE